MKLPNLPWWKRYCWSVIYARLDTHRKMALGLLLLAAVAFITQTLTEARASEEAWTNHALTCLNGGRFKSVNDQGETVVTLCKVEEFNIGRES